MTAHELAAYLLTLPDLPVFINGWSSDEGVECEVSKAIVLKDGDGVDKKIHLDYEEINWGPYHVGDL